MAYLCASYGFHYSLLKACADAHYLARCLHLRTKLTLCINELIKRPLGQLAHDVVDSRLVAGIGLARNGILDLVKCKADSYLRCYLCDRIARCL